MLTQPLSLDLAFHDHSLVFHVIDAFTYFVPVSAEFEVLSKILIRTMHSTPMRVSAVSLLLRPGGDLANFRA